MRKRAGLSAKYKPRLRRTVIITKTYWPMPRPNFTVRSLSNPIASRDDRIATKLLLTSLYPQNIPRKTSSGRSYSTVRLVCLTALSPIQTLSSLPCVGQITYH